MVYLILGCGWIGETLANILLKEGHQVYASTTNEQKYQRLQAAGIFAIWANFDVEIATDVFPRRVDFVLNSIPAVKRLPEEQLQRRFQRLHALLLRTSYRKHIFLSSIGAYPDIDGVYAEDYKLESVANNLLHAESILSGLPDSIVYRLGGLFGGERVFAKYFEHKVCTTGAQLANFVHRDDVIRLICRGFEQPLSEKLYNIVAPDHPTKKEVILASANKYGYAEPSGFQDEDTFQKWVCGEKIRKELNYSFIYPSALVF